MNENERKTYWQDGKWRMILDGQERSDNFTQYLAGLENKAASMIPMMKELAQAGAQDERNAVLIEKLKQEIDRLRLRSNTQIRTEARKLAARYAKVERRKGMPWRRLLRDSEKFLEWLLKEI